MHAAPRFYSASRGHHADIGGITAGSIPPFSASIADEGVLIDNFKLIERGTLHEDALRGVLSTGAHPSRNPAQNLADLRAQVAANEKGVWELKAAVAQHSRDTVVAYMHHVQDNAEESVRRVITALKDGEFTLPLDNGAQVCVRVRVDRGARSACIDFSGTSGQQRNNFNAPRAITTAAVLYVFRTLVNDDIPLNAGCLKPLQIILPEGCMLNPQFPAAVVAAMWNLDLPHQRYTGHSGSWQRTNAHEQFHIRQRAVSILRDRGRRLRCRPNDGTAWSNI